MYIYIYIRALPRRGSARPLRSLSMSIIRYTNINNNNNNHNNNNSNNNTNNNSNK